MKITVFGDVHGNLPALERLLSEEGDSDGFVCLGDTVGYGPWDNECVERIAELDRCVCLEGNHERYYRQGRCDEGAGRLARLFFEQTYPSFGRFELLEDYRAAWSEWGWAFRHAPGDAYLFPDSPFPGELPGKEKRLFLGHSHVAFFKYREGRIVCNPGSVGQNRREGDVLCYARLFPGEGEGGVELRAIAYDANSVVAEMRARNYPDDCLEYYRRRISNDKPTGT